MFKQVLSNYEEGHNLYKLDMSNPVLLVFQNIDNLTYPSNSVYHIIRETEESRVIGVVITKATDVIHKYINISDEDSPEMQKTLEEISKNINS